MDIPNLAGVATADLVETISGSGSFKASYINWSRTMQLLRVHAPGWMPEMIVASDGGLVHSAAIGGFLLIRFSHADGSHTPPVPQAIMDTRNAAIPLAKITARDITDTHRRGVCMAAAFWFGLAYELWAKLPLESGFAEPEKKVGGQPQDGMRTADFPDDRQVEIVAWSGDIAQAFTDGDVALACKLWKDCDLPHEEKAACWGELDSKARSAMKKHMKAAT